MTVTFHSTLYIETAWSCELLVTYHVTTHRDDPEDQSLNYYMLKSYFIRNLTNLTSYFDLGGNTLCYNVYYARNYRINC